MGIDVKWDESGRLPEKSLIYWLFDGTWDWADFAKADKCAYELAFSMADAHTVHSIIDFRASKSIPASGAISYFTRSIQKAPPNRGKVVVMGAPGIIKAMESVLRLLSPNAAGLYGYHFVDTLDEAFAILCEYNQQVASPRPPTP